MASSDCSRPIVDVRGLSKYFGPFVAVHNVSFAIPDGEIVALLGANGAGKTTLMRMLTGYLAPSSGTALVSGFDVQRERLVVAAKIGYLSSGRLVASSTRCSLATSHRARKHRRRNLGRSTHS